MSDILIFAIKSFIDARRNKVYKVIYLLILFYCFILQWKKIRDNKWCELKMNSIAEGYVKLVLEVENMILIMLMHITVQRLETKGSKSSNWFNCNAKLISNADSLLNELELLSEYKATELETLSTVIFISSFSPSRPN